MSLAWTLSQSRNLLYKRGRRAGGCAIAPTNSAEFVSPGCKKWAHS